MAGPLKTKLVYWVFPLVISAPEWGRFFQFKGLLLPYLRHIRPTSIESFTGIGFRGSG